MLLKEAYHDHSSQYMMGSQIYTFTSTSTERVSEGQRQFLGVPYVKLTLAMDSVFAQFHAKIHNIKKKQQEKAHFQVNTLIFFQKSDFGNFFHGVIIINVHVIIYH